MYAGFIAGLFYPTSSVLMALRKHRKQQFKPALGLPAGVTGKMSQPEINDSLYGEIMCRGVNFRSHTKYTTCEIFEKEMCSHRSCNNDKIIQNTSVHQTKRRHQIQ